MGNMVVGDFHETGFLGSGLAVSGNILLVTMTSRPTVGRVGVPVRRANNHGLRWCWLKGVEDRTESFHANHDSHANTPSRGPPAPEAFRRVDMESCTKSVAKTGPSMFHAP